MTPDQERFFAELPSDAGERLRKVGRVLESMEDEGDTVICNNWPFYQALSAEWGRIQAGIAADRKAQEHAPAPAAEQISA